MKPPAQSQTPPVERTIVRQVRLLDAGRARELEEMARLYGEMMSHFTFALKSRELRHEAGNGYSFRDRLVNTLDLDDASFQGRILELKAQKRTVECDLLEFLRWKNSQPVGSKLQARHWKLALEETMQMMNTHWASVTEAVKSKLLSASCEQWDAEQKEYIRWLLTPASPQFFHLLKKKIPLPTYDGYRTMGVSPEKIAEKKLFAKLPDNIRHIAYKVLGYVNHIRSTTVRAPRGRKRSNRIDFDCSARSKPKNAGKNQVISLMSLYPNKRIRMEVLGYSSLRGTLQLMIEEGGYRLNASKSVASAANTSEPKLVGLDLGYTEVIVSEDGTHYGQRIGEIMSGASDERNTRYRNKNRFHAKAAKLKTGTAEERKKARRIEKYNLGAKKKNEKLRKTKEHLKSLINRALNEFFKTGITQVAVEKLSVFLKSKFSKEWNRRLSSWLRSYIKERLIFKAQKFNVELIEINPAYTSQTCPECGFVDSKNRSGDKFKCLHCGFSDDADRVGAVNIARRVSDKEISLYTPFKKVQKILTARFKKSQLEKKHTV
jgi:IS605 OrfB family transposase